MEHKKQESKTQSNLIKSVKKLPAWFKLENYQKAKYFNADEWYDELMPRLYLRYCLKKYGKGSDDLPPNWELIKQKGLLFHVAKDEEIKFRVSSVSPDIVRVKALQDKEEQPAEQESTSVVSLPNFYVYGSYWLDTEEQQIEIAKKMKILLGEYEGTVSDDVKREAAKWVHKSFDDFPIEKEMGLKNKFAYAKIDLDASDEQIKRDLAIWLAQERERRDKPAPKKNFNQVDFDSWHEGAILPYLDLMFWAEIKEIKITQYITVQAIYPDAYSTDSDVDPLSRLKTTKKKAEYLMDSNTMKLLELQITG